MIRKADVSDAVDVGDIWNWMIRETLATFSSDEKSTSQIKVLITGRPDSFFVAEDHGRITGFVTFGRFRSGNGYAATVEHSVIIRPAHTRLGVGRSLMITAMDAASRQGHHVMIGAISAANQQAVKFHKKLGFECSGRLSEVGRKNGQWLDLILMQKMLSSPS